MTDGEFNTPYSSGVIANCMAVVRGYPGAVSCDGEQQAWSSGIWVGAVR